MQERISSQKVRGQLTFTFILLFAAGFLAWLVVKDFPQKREIGKQVSDLKLKIEALEKDEKKQEGMADYLNSESYLEKQARIRLNLKKEGEEAVFVYRKDEAENPAGEQNEDENPFLSKLKELIRIIWSRD